MNCPTCGSPTSSDQKFCRSCGVGLGNADIPSTNPRLRLFRIGLFTMFLSLILVFAGTTLLHLDIAIFVGLVGMISGMFLIGYSAVGFSRGPKRYVPIGESNVLPQAETTRKLTPMNDIDFAPSVTERTTSLLETPVSTSNKK